MIRLHMVVEGQTEENFVNNILANHLGCRHQYRRKKGIATISVALGQIQLSRMQ